LLLLFLLMRGYTRRVEGAEVGVHLYVNPKKHQNSKFKLQRNSKLQDPKKLQTSNSKRVYGHGQRISKTRHYLPRYLVNDELSQRNRFSSARLWIRWVAAGEAVTPGRRIWIVAMPSWLPIAISESGLSPTTRTSFGENPCASSIDLKAWSLPLGRASSMASMCTSVKRWVMPSALTLLSCRRRKPEVTKNSLAGISARASRSPYPFIDWRTSIWLNAANPAERIAGEKRYLSAMESKGKRQQSEKAARSWSSGTWPSLAERMAWNAGA